MLCQIHVNLVDAVEAKSGPSWELRADDLSTVSSP